jgi:phosphoribosylaminoimidazole-succinocarboxamide synthase
LSYLSNSKLIKPLLLTTKKDDDGLEIEISVDEAAQEYGWGPIDIAIEAFGLANEIALKRDIIIADAEIKFGYDSLGDLILAGGILTYRDTNNCQVLDYSEVLRRLTC